ncbi:ATP-binding cassette domain-containing protein [Limnobacter humi]|uniref:ATP-binding cassette domain-containing protein n=1 Tax=Limnobacter humi TaxID=1778671 RepID=A0ABT1WHZ7_9BURK|nr:ATP-binding cassette domain-containing protein [Limnobacter humi]MCQ8896049.1 ATP-binding cassette domain-containing protein [Limnobacter humi]
MIQITGLSIARGSKSILKQANLTLFPKEKVGLIGHNGAGKSSFFASLLGELPVDAGNIEIPQAWSVAWIDQEVTANDTPVIDFALEGDRALHTIRQQIRHAESSGESAHIAHLYEQLDNLDGYTAESRVATILHGLGFKPEDLQRNVGEFSGGWKMRLNLAKVLGSRAELILLDEPTNHLDIEAVLWLAQWIRQVDCTVLVISHDREFLDEICTHTVHLHGEQLVKYTGNYSTFERTFAERAEQVDQANRKASAEIEKLQRFVERFKAKATKAKQAQSRVKRIEKIKLIETYQVQAHAEIPFLEPHKSPDPLVVLARAACGYNAEKPVISGLNLEIRPGDRIGLLGSNGNGKTTLVKSLVGDLPLLSGDRVEGKGLVVGYFAQDQIESLDMAATPLQHLARVDRQATEQQLRDFLARFDFRDEKVRQTVGNFSGGEKSRLALALLAYLRPNLLLLDEPTNHLDMSTRQALVNSLIEFEGALVMVSHDRHLLESITDTYWRVHAGQVSPFDGDLEDYANLLKKESSQTDRSKEPAKATQGQPTDRQAAHQRLKTLRNQIKKIEKQLEECTAQRQLADTALHNLDYSKPDTASLAARLAHERETAHRQVEDHEFKLLELMLESETLESELGL